MPAKYIYPIVLLVMLSTWFAKPTVPVTAPPPAPPAVLTKDSAALGIDLPGARTEGQCNLETVNQTLLGTTAFPVQKNAQLNVSGWAMDSGNVRLPKNVIVRFTGAKETDFFAVAQIGLPRADVKEYFKVPDTLIMSGFQLLIPALDLPADSYQLTLMMRFDDATYICDNGRKLSVQ